MLGPLKEEKPNKKLFLHADSLRVLLAASRVVLSICGPYRVVLPIIPNRTCAVLADHICLRILSLTCDCQEKYLLPSELYLKTLQSRSCRPSRVVLADPSKSICATSRLRTLPNRTRASFRVVPAMRMDPL
jgi:hypothetical protein